MTFVRPLIEPFRIFLLLPVVVSIVGAAEPQVAQTPHSISVRWPEVDAWRQAGQPLHAVVEFHEADAGPAARRVELDLSDPATGSAAVFAKPQGASYRRLSLTVNRGQERLLQVEAAVPKVVTPGQSLPVGAESVVLEGAADVDAASLPRVPAPDRARIRAAQWAKPVPERELAKHRRLVTSDFDPPITFALALVANQTAHPHDGTRKSVYVAASNPLFNATSGELESRLHYLIELPIDPQWVRDGGDTVVRMDPAAIRVHMDRRMVPIGGSSLRITGERSGGLSQGQYQALVGDDGNLYFSMPYRGPLRFNVAKAAFEVAPVDVVVWYTQQLQQPQRRQELARLHGDAFEVRPDIDSTLFAHQGRIYVMFGRYLRLRHGNRPDTTDLLSSALISIPQGDAWYDPAAFGRDLRLHAEGFPGGPLSLYDAVPPVGEERLKIRELSGMGEQLILWSYDYDRLWRLELDGAGQTRRILPVTHLAGRKIVKFAPTARWFHRDGRPLGVALGVTLEGEEKTVEGYLAAEAQEISTQTPPTDAQVFDTSGAPVLQRRIVAARGRGYGQSSFRKASLQTAAGLAADGALEVTWDARGVIREAMKASAGAESSAGTALSAGPGYLLVPLPGTATMFLGAADYPSYYLSVYSLAEKGGVRRRHLLTGTEAEPRAVTTGLGPYASVWTRQADAWSLWVVGYTGVARLPWPADGSIPERVQTESAGLYLEDAVPLDGAAPGPIRWMNRVLPGLGGKVLVTGYNQVSRGGTAYSGGVRWLPPEPGATWQSLSRLARGHRMTGLATRLKIGAAGEPALDVLAVGVPDQASTLTLGDEAKPNPIQSRLFVMTDRGDRLHDRFSLALGAAQAPVVAVEDVATSASGLHGLLVTDDGELLAMDLDTWQFTDAVRLPGRVLSSDRAPALVPLADGQHALFVAGGSDLESILVRVHVTPAGEIQVRPLARLKMDRPDALKGARAVVGSTLVLGPPAMKDDATLTVLPNILKARGP